MAQHQQDNWASVPAAIDRVWKKKPQRFCLQLFLRMEPGDKVVVPIARAFHLYEVVDGARLTLSEIKDELTSLEIWRKRNAAIIDGGLVEMRNPEERTRDLGFFRRVKCLNRDISRKEHANASLTSALKYRRSTADITRCAQDVEDATRRSIDLRKLIKKQCACKIRDAIVASQDPDQFEKLIESYLGTLGAKTFSPPKNEPGKEGDADVVATFDALKLVVYVQAKRHKGETQDAYAVEQIALYKDSKEGNETPDGYIHVTWVVSTAKFSDHCREQAEIENVRLIDGIEFAEMLLDAGIEHI